MGHYLALLGGFVILGIIVVSGVCSFGGVEVLANVTLHHVTVSHVASASQSSGVECKAHSRVAKCGSVPPRFVVTR